MYVLKLKIVGRVDYSMCFIRPPYFDKVCEGWIDGKKIDERLYFDDDFWCLSRASKNYLKNLGYNDYAIEVDGATNKDDYRGRIMLDDGDLPLVKPEKRNVGSIDDQFDAFLLR